MFAGDNGVNFAASSNKATGIPKRAALVALSDVHGNKGISFDGSVRVCVEMSKPSNDSQEVNDSGATHALR